MNVGKSRKKPQKTKKKNEMPNSRAKLNIGEMVKQYQRQLQRFIRRRVSSDEDAEDILQDVFYKLAKADAMMTPIEHVSGWLYKVARNQIYDWRLSKKAGDKWEQDEALLETPLDDLAEILLSPADTPEMEYLRKQIWHELELALAELPPEQREVFELTEFAGMSFKEIAAAQNVPVNTLMSRKHYAVLYLRKKLTGLYCELLEI